MQRKDEVVCMFLLYACAIPFYISFCAILGISQTQKVDKLILHIRALTLARESVSLCFLFHVLCFNNLFGYGAARFFRFFLSLRRDGEMIEKGEKTFQHSLTSSSSSASSCFYKFAGLRACLAGAKRRPMTKIFFVALLWLRAFVQGIITIM